VQIPFELGLEFSLAHRTQDQFPQGLEFLGQAHRKSARRLEPQVLSARLLHGVDFGVGAAEVRDHAQPSLPQRLRGKRLDVAAAGLRLLSSRGILGVWPGDRVETIARSFTVRVNAPVVSKVSDRE